MAATEGGGAEVTTERCEEIVTRILAKTEREKAKRTIGILQRVVQNIQADPAEPKFKCLRRSNPKIAELVCQVEGAEAFLMLLGFRPRGGGKVLEIEELSPEAAKTALNVLTRVETVGQLFLTGDSSDVSVVVAHFDVVAEMGLYRGDSVLVSGEALERLPAIVIAEEIEDSRGVHLHADMQRMLNTEKGGMVTIEPCAELPFLHRISFTTKNYAPGIQELDETDMFEAYLSPFFRDAFRPMATTMTFWIEKEVELEVIATDPPRPGIVGPETVLHVDDMTLTKSAASFGKRDNC